MMRRVLVGSVVSGEFCRAISTRGQYNPIHDFNAVVERDIKPASMEEFKSMVTNPGPLRVTYTPDYLDWYYRAYNEKVRFAALKKKAAATFAAGGSITGAAGAPAGKFARPPHSTARQKGEAQRKEALADIAACAVQHGLHDCFERRPQFPCIHIDRCTNDHILELYRTLFLDAALTSTEIWDKALMHRALLLDRKAVYPASFKYILDAAEQISLATPVPDPNDPKETIIPDKDKFPLKEAADYFESLVKKYHVDNAVEAHVLLQVHRLPDAETLMQSVPAPKDDVASVPVPDPLAYPPLPALESAEENISLLMALIFAEFNGVVTVDPFAKFPNAQSHVLRPGNETANPLRRAGGTGSSLLLSGKRTEKLFVPYTDATKTLLQTRGADVMRLQEQHAKEDVQFNRELARIAEETPEHLQADYLNYNPRTVRAEIRDTTSRKMLKALKKYDDATDLIYREPLEVATATVATQRVIEHENPPASRPTLPHFVRLITKDPHVSLVLALGANDVTSKVRQATVDLARVMFLMALDYHKQDVRLVNNQKRMVTAAVLDRYVADEIDAMRRGLVSEAATEKVRFLGEFTPFAGRKLDESGFPSEARFDDQQRWSRAPAMSSSMNSN